MHTGSSASSNIDYDNQHSYVIRLVRTMKIMHIESELIRITCIHTECALTTICIECAFSQSTSIGGLKPASIELVRLHHRAVIYYARHYNCVISKSSRIKQKSIFMARVTNR